MAREYIWATGRRKSAVARIRITPGSGNILVNHKSFDKYFFMLQDKICVLEPLQLTKRLDRYDVFADTHGGGISAQASAIRHGISRALVKAEPELITVLKSNKLLTRDPRMKERKKYGKLGARKGQQYSKR